MKVTVMYGAMVGLGASNGPLKFVFVLFCFCFFFFLNIIKYMNTNFSNFVLEIYTFVLLKILLILLKVLLYSQIFL